MSGFRGRVTLGIVMAVLAGAAMLLAVVDGASAGTDRHGARTAVVTPTITYVANSTQKVCQLVGQTDNETGEPTPSRTASRYGIAATDQGFSFMHDGRVWFLFGDSWPTTTFQSHPNASTRYPADPSGFDNDSIASAAPSARGSCPVLDFVSESEPVPGAYANPSLTRNGVPVSLRINETPMAGIDVNGNVYATFTTGNPVDAGLAGNCPPGSVQPGQTCAGHPTESVMGVLEPGGTLQFKALYTLSAPSTPYGNGAKFVRNSIERGNDGYIYIWGAPGVWQAGESAPYLARLRPANIATGDGIEYFSGYLPNGRPNFEPGESNATPLFNDSPSCTSYLGQQWNPYVHQWIMIYNCADDTAAHPFGVWMRTAPNPWGPYSAPQTIFNPIRDHGYCYFIHSNGACPNGSPNPTNSDHGVGEYYAPFFIANWTTGTFATRTEAATSTLYYTLSTWNPYGVVILKSAIRASLPIVTPRRCPAQKPGTSICSRKRHLAATFAP